MSAAQKLDDTSSKITANLAIGMELACLIPETAAKQKCPVDEGILRASISHEIDVSPSKIIGRIGTNIEYAPYVHQGTGIYAVDGNGRKTPWAWFGESKKWEGIHHTVGQKPKRFLKEAVEENKSRIISILKNSQGGIKI